MSEQPLRFADLGIAPNLLKVLDSLKFVTPTPIQRKAIPAAMEGNDVLGIAQTGTGKTLAFGLPLLQRISAAKGTGLVITPTRELAVQVDQMLQQVGRKLGLRTAVLIGGESEFRQKDALRKRPHVIVATPGRLLDHLEKRAVDLKTTKVLVLDEADRMLDMGFAPQLRRIMQHVPKERQTMLFSATMPASITKMANTYMHLPLRIEVAPQGTAAERVEQEMYVVAKADKIRLLEATLAKFTGKVIVFSRTKHGAKRITRQVNQMGHRAEEIHGNRSQSQRQRALENFKGGRSRILVATDIAARGLDVEQVELVVNFDLPMQAEDYIHRIGRTGRAGKSGNAISFATPDQRSEIRQIERLMEKRVPMSTLPQLPPHRASLPPEPERPPFRGRGGSGHYRGGSGRGGASSGGRSGGYSGHHGGGSGGRNQKGRGRPFNRRRRP